MDEIVLAPVFQLGRLLVIAAGMLGICMPELRLDNDPVANNIDAISIVGKQA